MIGIEYEKVLMKSTRWDLGTFLAQHQMDNGTFQVELVDFNGKNYFAGNNNFKVETIWPTTCQDTRNSLQFQSTQWTMINVSAIVENYMHCSHWVRFVGPNSDIGPL